MRRSRERAVPPIEIVHLAYTSFPADTRLKREALAAAATGHRVAVITLRADNRSAVERFAGLTVIRVPGRKSRGGLVSYLAEYLEFTWRCRQLLGRHRRMADARVIHVHTLPDFLVWSAGPAQRRGARLILDLHEILPEFAASKNPGAFGRTVATLARWIERWARRRADVVITVNVPIDALLARRNIGRPEHRVVIHNSPDPEDFGELRHPSLATRRSRTIELVYHGTLTPLYGLDVAVRGLALTAGRGVQARLTIIGEGPQRLALERLVHELGVDALVRFESRLPQEALAERLSHCDAGVVPTRLDEMTRYSLSNKLLEYVHLGLPVLAARLPSYAHYFGEDAAWYWKPGNPGDLARAIGDFATAPPAERAARARRAQLAVTAIAWPSERARLLKVYTELLGSR